MVRAIILAVALVSGGVASYLSMGHTRTHKVMDTQDIAHVEEILVTADEIDVGDKLQDKDFRWQRWPSDAIGPGLITKKEAPEAVEEFSGTTSRAKFAAGEPVRKEKLVGQSSGLLSASLPQGKRAIAVKISAGNTAGGFIVPNDRVDVIHTGFRALRDQREGSVSRTVLSNIRVLAIDGEGGDKSAPAAGRTATLELDPTQVEIISAAEASGLISLSLRPFSDDTETRTPTLVKSNTVQMIKSGRMEIVRTKTEIGD